MWANAGRCCIGSTLTTNPSSFHLKQSQRHCHCMQSLGIYSMLFTLKRFPLRYAHHYKQCQRQGGGGGIAIGSLDHICVKTVSLLRPFTLTLWIISDTHPCTGSFTCAVLNEWQVRIQRSRCTQQRSRGILTSLYVIRYKDVECCTLKKYTLR